MGEEGVNERTLWQERAMARTHHHGVGRGGGGVDGLVFIECSRNKSITIEPDRLSDRISHVKYTCFTKLIGCSLMADGEYIGVAVCVDG